MSIFSSQKWFCAACGVEQNTPMTNSHKCQGVEWKTCSYECSKEIQWRRTLSILGKPYKERAKD